MIRCDIVQCYGMLEYYFAFCNLVGLFAIAATMALFLNTYRCST